jgi:hypothetical protein
MSTFRILLFFLLFFSLTALKSQNITISGYVREASSGEEIINAQVIEDNSRKAVTTNAYGFFSLTVPGGRINLLVSSGGFDTRELGFTCNKDTTMDVELIKSSLQLETVTIKSRSKQDNVRKIDMSTNRLSGQAIKKIPAFLGEVDVVRSIQLLPGVSTVGEGSSGFNVRGGSTDQNLILLDEAPVFNSSHLFGFFSIFNPDVVKDVQLIKGGRFNSLSRCKMRTKTK